jgi:hypothetical protein
MDLDCRAITFKNKGLPAITTLRKRKKKNEYYLKKEEELIIVPMETTFEVQNSWMIVAEDEN